MRCRVLILMSSHQQGIQQHLFMFNLQDTEDVSKTLILMSSPPIRNLIEIIQIPSIPRAIISYLILASFLFK